MAQKICVFPHRHKPLPQRWSNVSTAPPPAENGILEPFKYKNEHFAKTGSGQT
jgi:hypothetical protein